MREIKFRGKRVDGSGWVFGSYLQQYFSSKHQQLIDAIAYVEYFDGYAKTINPPVDSETVGQYSGLIVKDKVEICEHDFVKAYGEIWLVDFKSGGFRFNRGKYCLGWRSLANNREDYRVWVLIRNNFEVVGNKTDNPELLKEVE